MILHPAEKKRRANKRRAGVLSGKVLIGPERFYLPITNRCNLTCCYCWFHSKDNPARLLPRLDVPLKRLKSMVADCVALEVDSLYLSGEGEPTLHPQFAAMMALLEDKPMETVLFTNGAFPAARCRDVIKADEVVVNLGAADRESYMKLQGADLFERVVANIKELARLRDASKPAFKITLDFVVTNVNLDQREAVQRLFMRLAGGEFRATALRDCPYNRDLRTTDAQGVLIGKGAVSPVCVNGWYFCIATLGGDVRYCFQRAHWRINGMAARSLREVWFSPAFMKARLEGKCGRLGKVFEECQNCLYDKYNVQWLSAQRRIKAVLLKSSDGH